MMVSYDSRLYASLPVDWAPHTITGPCISFPLSISTLHPTELSSAPYLNYVQLIVKGYKVYLT